MWPGAGGLVLQGLQLLLSENGSDMNCVCFQRLRVATVTRTGHRGSEIEAGDLAEATAVTPENGQTRSRKATTEGEGGATRNIF